MKRLLLMAWGLAALAAAGRAAEDGFDRLDAALTGSTAAGGVRVRLSGTLDLEGYHFSQPPPGLIVAAGTGLFNPRLTLFLDLQLGGRVYAFVQARADRGFDPSNGPVEGRLDEYALRVTPWADGRVSFQAGKFATVVGNWVRRHGSWEDPFVTAPLPYENLTGMWDVAAVRSAATLLRWAHIRPKSFSGEQFSDNHYRLPLIWGPDYGTGFAASGALGRFNYAAEVKNGALSARPAAWPADEVRWRHPTLSGRLGYRPDERWSLGWSASAGSYLLPVAAPRWRLAGTSTTTARWCSRRMSALPGTTGRCGPSCSPRASSCPWWGMPRRRPGTWRPSTSSRRSWPARCAGTSSCSGR